MPRLSIELKTALMLRDEGRYEEAEKQCAKLLKLQPENSDAHYIIGLIKLDQALAQEALDQFNRAIKLGKTNGDYWMGATNALLNLNRPHEAFRTIDDIIKKGLDWPQAVALRERARKELSLIAEKTKISPGSDQDQKSYEEFWTLKIANDVRICVPADIECPATYVVLEQEKWYDPATSFASMFVKPGMTVVDISDEYGINALSIAKSLDAESNVSIKACHIQAVNCIKASIQKNDFACKTSVALSLANDADSFPNCDLIIVSSKALTFDSFARQIPSFRERAAILILHRLGEQSNPSLWIKALNSNDVGIYRYLPALNCLVEAGESDFAGVKPGVVFAFNPSIAADLEQNGLLASWPENPDAPTPSIRPWAQSLAAFPYVASTVGRNSLYAGWKSTDYSRHPNWQDYNQSLSWYLSAITTGQSSTEGLNLLIRSRKKIKELVDIGDTHFATLMLRIRVLNECGEREEALQLTRNLVGMLENGAEIELDRPFLPPISNYDYKPPTDGLAPWLIGSVFECAEHLRAESSIFVREEKPYRSVQWNGIHPEMERRVLLHSALQGAGLRLEKGSRLRVLNDVEHLNADWWSKLPTPHSEQAANAGPSSSALNLPVLDAVDLQLNENHQFQVILDDDSTMEFFFFGGTTYSAFGLSLDRRWVAKIELQVHPLKQNTLLQEAEIIRRLNTAKCVSCPLLGGVGRVSKSELPPTVQTPETAHEFSAIIMAYIPTESTVGLHDLLLTILEQQKLGWFHADIRPENLRFNPRNKVCYLIDYDQAEPLTDDQINLPFVEFLRWADQRVRNKYHQFGYNGIFCYFSGVTLDHSILPRLDHGRVDVGATKLFSSAETTLNESKIYHAIDLPDVVAHGERNLRSRLRLIDNIEFSVGERVLDVGCNSGLLCAYLAKRGCEVTGYDLDPCIIDGARMLSHIRGDASRVSFACIDLDRAESIGSFDTIMLFSVLHHTENVERNAKLIAEACSRIIIECRIKEVGQKPKDGKWVETTSWNYESVDDLINDLCRYFPGFVFSENYGQADRNRYVLEFKKKSNLGDSCDPSEVKHTGSTASTGPTLANISRGSDMDDRRVAQIARDRRKCRKNVLLLTIDGLRYDRTGFGGHYPTASPTLDELMSSGLSTIHGFSSGFPTQFALPAIFTSTLPLDNGGYNFGIRDRKSSFVEVLRENGYQTSGFVNGFWETALSRYNRGFDHFFSCLSPRLIAINYRVIYFPALVKKYRAEGSLDRCADFFFHFFNELFAWINIYCAEKEAELFDNSFVRSPVTHNWEFRAIQEISRKEQQKFSRNHRKYIADLIQYNGASGFDLFLEHRKVRLTYDSAAMCVSGRFMRNCTIHMIDRFSHSEKPFFIWAHFLDVHDCQYLSHDVFGELEDKQLEIQAIKKHFEEIQRNSKSYAGSVHYDLAVRYVDYQVKKIMDRLAEQGLLENTLIILTSDHGYRNAGKPWRQDIDVGHFYDEMYRIPITFNGPGIEPARTKGLFSSLDIAPTLLDYLGLKIPESFRGRSLFDKNFSQFGHPHLIFENMGRGLCDFATKSVNVCVRGKDKKLNYSVSPGTPPEMGSVLSFYDLLRDPEERQDRSQLNGEDLTVYKDIAACRVDEVLSHSLEQKT